MLTREVYVTGMAQLRTALDSMPRKIAGTVMRDGMRVLAKTMRKSVVQSYDESGLKNRSGRLRKSIKATVRLQAGSPRGFVKVGAWYSHFLEGGAAPHVTGGFLSGFPHPGIPATHFVLKALERNAPSAIAVFRDAVREKLLDGGWIKYDSRLYDTSEEEVQ